MCNHEPFGGNADGINLLCQRIDRIGKAGVEQRRRLAVDEEDPVAAVALVQYRDVVHVRDEFVGHQCEPHRPPS